MMTRFVLLHYHTFKHAGSTIDWILEHNFQRRFHSLDESYERGLVTNTEIVRFLMQHPDAQAVSSHQIRLPAPRHEMFAFIDIWLARHPLDRLQSMYLYYKRIENQAVPNSARAQELSLGKWLEWLLENEPFNVLNAQTSLIARGGSYYFPPSRLDLELALETIRGIGFLGVVERFDESMICAERFLRPMFPALDLVYVPQNIDEGRESTLNGRLERMRALCGPSIFERLTKLNELDIKLWEGVSQELERRLGFIEDQDQRLRDFRARCNLLTGAG